MICVGSLNVTWVHLSPAPPDKLCLGYGSVMALFILGGDCTGRQAKPSYTSLQLPTTLGGFHSCSVSLCSLIWVRTSVTFPAKTTEILCFEAQPTTSSWSLLVRLFINMPPVPLLYFGVGRQMLCVKFQLDMKNQHEKLQAFCLRRQRSTEGCFQSQAGEGSLGNIGSYFTPQPSNLQTLKSISLPDLKLCFPSDL